jgi:myo-inositol 2-dehydrogenase/D-chiro-inositol 1-dehydrogenase
MSSQQPLAPVARRDFLKTSTAAVVGGMLAGGLSLGRSAHAANGDDLLKVGLIGCGGRGTGAASQALHTQGNVRLVAMADTFADRLEGSLTELQADPEIADRIDVPPERRFTGFDGYKQVIDSDVDVVLLTTPPHFRPAQLKAAVDAGKHVFCEKPVAVDAPGVRSVLETVEQARQKNLSIVSGLCWRYDLGVRETVKRIQDGQIGDVVAMQVTYNTGGLWNHTRQPDWSDMEYQVRNWLYYTWLSGDHNVEQHIHTLDKAAWILGDAHPIAATGLGGRQVRTDEKWGNIFDHHSVVYEFDNGIRVFSLCRQQDGCTPDNSARIMGSTGRADVLRHVIEGSNSSADAAWKYSGPKPNMYQVEHDELFASIRSGNPINNGVYMAQSTLMAIMGRMATYTGQTITWDQAFNSQEDLTPPAYEWGPLAVAPVAKPGITQFA